MIETTDLILREQDLKQIDQALQTMLRDSRAHSVILINRDDGGVLAAQGFLDSLDTTSLGALAAGTFASAREIARLIGEPEFSVLFHQGRREHVHVNLAGPHGLLMTLFDDTTTVGLVRLSARRACAAVQRALSAEEPE
jgi:predicted regulator of Ras-like GTPase activity (Roadblock/LC7/MglB family)